MASTTWRVSTMALPSMAPEGCTARQEPPRMPGTGPGRHFGDLSEDIRRC